MKLKSPDAVAATARSLINWFLGIAGFLTIVSASAAHAQTNAEGLNPAEEWVVSQVTAGRQADLTKRFPEEQNRKLRGHFLEQLLTGTLPGVQVDRNGVHITGAIIDQWIQLRNAQIPFEAFLMKCQFNEPVTFEGTSFGGRTLFWGSTFNKGAIFAFVKGGQSLDFMNAVFRSGTNFIGMKIGGEAVFSKAEFEGKVIFRGTELGNLQAGGAEFKDEAIFDGVKCEGTGNFKGATFVGPVSFANSNFQDLLIAGKGAGAAPIPRFDLSRSLIKRQLEISKIAVGDFIAPSLHVEGPADFGDLTVQKAADLSDSDFAALNLSRSNWPTHAKDLHIQGMNYKYLRAAEDESESHKALLKLVGQSAYSADVYGNLEAFFKRQGYIADADRVFIAGKRRERSEYLHGLPWLGSLLIDWLVGYGRRPWQAGIPCLFFVALGCVLFSPRKMEPQKPDDAPRVYSRFWYSLGLFLPFVDLQADKVWKPKADQIFLRNYMRVHILLGWILIPLVLAALTGLIK